MITAFVIPLTKRIRSQGSVIWEASSIRVISKSIFLRMFRPTPTVGQIVRICRLNSLDQADFIPVRVVKTSLSFSIRLCACSKSLLYINHISSDARVDCIILERQIGLSNLGSEPQHLPFNEQSFVCVYFGKAFQKIINSWSNQKFISLEGRGLSSQIRCVLK